MYERTFSESEKKLLKQLTTELLSHSKISPLLYAKVLKKYAQSSGDMFSKNDVIAYLRTQEVTPELQQLVEAIQMKPVRTQSGVAPITVLTKPFPCPGTCIFCPNDIRMPKSYLSDEPGAQRAERNFFDPYLQTYNRLQALTNIGHTVTKAELIVLGGTWSFYTEQYQIWFIRECLRALNDFGSIDGRPEVLEKYTQFENALESKRAYTATADPVQNKDQLRAQEIDGHDTERSYNQVISEVYVAPELQAGVTQYQVSSWEELREQQVRNETAAVRNVGMVIETRPDSISEAEVRRIRQLGCTKTQIGVQSLQDDVLRKNKRGHDVAATRRAFALLRRAGFKIHAHWMANLYGSSVAADTLEYLELFSDPDFKPDELKVYPCSLIGSAELMQYYKKGLWKPYTYEELLSVVAFALENTPEYCRLTRVIRDIPSTDIVAGNHFTNFRQIAEAAVAKAGKKSVDIRAREIKNERYTFAELTLTTTEYLTSVARELFVQYITPENKIVAFIRVSIPTAAALFAELEGAAIIRELHVYGQLVDVGVSSGTKSQHQGLGTRLLQDAERIARDNQLKQLAVISAIGTREYYRGRGFYDGELYQLRKVS